MIWGKKILTKICYKSGDGAGVLVAHACNPTYWETEVNQEDQGLRPARADSSRDPPEQKQTQNVAQVVE
jgi:hypothetical protein